VEIVTVSERMAQFYRTMRMIRRFEERVVTLVNANEIAGVTHEYIGQEAVATGVCAALGPDDVITSTHRGHGHVIAKGADISRMMAELLGRQTGLNQGRGGSMHIADVSLGILGANGMVGAGAPFAAGAAWAAKRAASDKVAVCFFGDGGVNQGVVMETMNLATLWRLPIIFACENNGYAITLSQTASTAGSPIARARAFGMEADEIDGMDVASVFEATERAVSRARSEYRPSFLEFKTYRFSGHHTAEHTMGFTYRDDEEIAQWRKRDPVLRAGQELDDATRSFIDGEVESILDDAVAYARSSPVADADSALDLMYADGMRARDVVTARASQVSTERKLV
jgi:acetoin:2,6-dichlorophenolindophenol oxidoreductase subunit alpha